MTCIRCGTKATRLLLPLELEACTDCHTVWIREEELWKFNGTGYREHMTRFVAELLKRTEAWALAWRAAA